MTTMMQTPLRIDAGTYIDFIPLPPATTPWPAPKAGDPGPMTLRRAWIHRRFLQGAVNKK